jgi:Fe2+ transport system protein FeoA
VPKIAVVNDKGEDVVYVDAGGTAERRVVTLGFVDETYAEVIEGVSEAEPVVVRGQRSLRHGQPIKVLEDGAVVTAESAS